MKRRLCTAIAACAAVLTLQPMAGSATSGNDMKPADKEGGAGPANLEGTSWLVEDIESRGVIDMAQTTLEFGADGQVSGSGGCNRYTGTVTIEGNAVSFGPMASTRMACAPALMDQEQKFFVAMGKVTAYRLDGNGLLFLLDADDAPLLRMSSVVVAAP